MAKDKARKAPDMSQYAGSCMPKAGVQYPKGKAKSGLAANMRKAFSKVKVRQVA